MMHIPGAGVGGHCLPKDTWLLKYSVDAYGRSKVATNVLVESRIANDYMPLHMKELIERALEEQNKQLNEARICILGFAFLEDSDDTRNTPALTLYNILKPICREVIVHDPYVAAYEGVTLTTDLEEAVKDRDCVAIVTRHREYLDIKLDWLKKLLATPVIVDGRNVFNPEEVLSSGFTFRGVGIGTDTKQSKKE
jgi:UDP-N-acetyl-D-mannosaminuronic acid dehydrogenase